MLLPESKRLPAYKHCKTAALLTLLIAIAFSAFAQSQTGDHGGQAAASASTGQGRKEAAKLTFDAASVRISSQKFFLKGLDFLDPVNHMEPPKGGLFSWNVQVGSLILFAYDLRSSQLRRGVGESLPKWAKDEWYVINARADENSTRAEVRQMVRSLLEERFKLAAHSETRDGQVFELVVAKPGLGLKPHPQGAPCTLSLPKVWAYPPYEGVPAHCGIFDRELGKYKRRLEMLDVTMQQIADALGRQLPLSIVDRTGLTEHYDATLDYGPALAPSDEDFSHFPEDSSHEVGLPVPASLEKQLGLKLVKQKAPVDVFVIEHIEKPSEN